LIGGGGEWLSGEGTVSKQAKDQCELRSKNLTWKLNMLASFVGAPIDSARKSSITEDE
jgi:hypothetical protein